MGGTTTPAPAGDGLTALERARALLARVDEVEPRVRAWAHLDRDFLLRQAAVADASPAAGPLHGVAVGLKDIIDTADLPTECGTVLHAGRQPAQDAVLVQRLKRAGALVMGKTVTTELATYAPGPTTNPHHAGHTPGGSSSGSAAAVAAGMVTLAVGTQTNGSVLRPASFCGVVGYKPSAGLIPRTGVLVQSPAFDCIGFFARDVEGVAMLAQALAGADAGDAGSRDGAVPPLHAVALQSPPVTPALAWNGQSAWARVAPDAQAAYEAWRVARGLPVLPLPVNGDEVVEHHVTVMEAEIAGSFEALWKRGAPQMSASLQGQIERGLKTSAVRVRRGLEASQAARLTFSAWFDAQGLDALAMPTALGTAPQGLSATGDPVMCTLASFAGLPAITLPLLQGANGLPLGVQLVGRWGDDARLLRTARWLMASA